MGIAGPRLGLGPQQRDGRRGATLLEQRARPGHRVARAAGEQHQRRAREQRGAARERAVARGGTARRTAHRVLGIRHRQRMVVRLDPALRGAFGRATCLTNEPTRQGLGSREEAGAPAVRSASSARALQRGQQARRVAQPGEFSRDSAPTTPEPIRRAAPGPVALRPAKFLSHWDTDRCPKTSKTSLLRSSCLSIASIQQGVTVSPPRGPE